MPITRQLIQARAVHEAKKRTLPLRMAVLPTGDGGMMLLYISA